MLTADLTETIQGSNPYQISNQTIKERIRTSKDTFENFSSSPVSHIEVSGSSQKLFSRSQICPNKIDSGSEEVEFDEENGYIESGLGITTGDIGLARHLFSVENLHEKILGTIDELKKMGVDVGYSGVVYRSKDKNGKERKIHDQLNIRICIGKNADEIAKKIEQVSEEGGYWEERRFIEDQKDMIILQFTDWEKTEISLQGRRRNKVWYGETGGHANVYMPYSPKINLQESIGKVNTVLTALSKAKILPISSKQPVFSFDYKESVRAQSPLSISITRPDYEVAVATVKEEMQKNELDTANPFVKYMVEDMDQAMKHPLSYFDSIHRTKNIIPAWLKEGKTIMVQGICDLYALPGKKIGLLTDHTDNIPPDLMKIRERNKAGFLGHELVVSDWRSKGRGDAADLVANSPMIRGYYFIAPDGLSIVASNEDIQKFGYNFEELKKIVLDTYGAQLVSADIASGAFDKATMLKQIEDASNINAGFLLRAGASDKDVEFYRTWFQKFYQEKSSIHTEGSWDFEGGTVAKKFMDLDAKVLGQRKLEKESASSVK